MRLLTRFTPGLAADRRDRAPLLLAMMGLFFLVVCAVGILRPIKNALALDGLADTEFYKVYLVSAIVVLFVPIYNRLADRISWRWLIPGVALFFAGNLLLFRAFYAEGSAAFGMLFYGWYDLFAAALVTQFFIATQLFYNSRNAKEAYPLVIAGGSIGATLGGAITGFFAERVGAPNLLLVAAALIGLFGLGLALVWRSEEPAPAPRPPARPRESYRIRELRAVFGHPHVRLIAAGVLLTVLVKQLVDYQFNTFTETVFQTRDAVSAFQGKFNAATQWLPILVLLALRPLLKRWGVGIAIVLLPMFMLVANFGLAVWWSLWAAVAAKAADTSLRYSAERAGREILYVPVPAAIKLKAKAYIDVAIEKGVGKATSALLIFALLAVLGYRLIPYVTLALSVLWLVLAATIRREYVHSLARSIEGRFASLQGVFASIADANTLPIVQQALAGGEVLQTAFALDLVEHAGPNEVKPLAGDLDRLLDHSSPDIRERALGLLAKFPDAVDPQRVRAKLSDASEPVREAAVRALCATAPGQNGSLLKELLDTGEVPVRRAVLSCLVRGEVSGDGASLVRGAYLERARPASPGTDAAAREELALAVGVLRDDADACALLEPFLKDPDARVASTALRSAGLLAHPGFYPALIAALATPATRKAARDALALQGAAAVPALSEALLDPDGDAVVRRSIPAVLARIPAQSTVDALLDSILAPETDQLLDYRTLKALSKLRSRHPELSFDPELVVRAMSRDVEAATCYAAARTALAAPEPDGRGVELLRCALEDAWRERRESVFRWLGLLHDPDSMYRCYLAVTRGAPTIHANALEWLERTIGHTLYTRIQSTLEDGVRAKRPPSIEPIVQALGTDGDRWIAGCAVWVSQELYANGTVQSQPGRGEMTLIENVFLLQQVDLLQGARSGDLALLASIAEEIEVESGTVLLEEGEPTDALYVIIGGAVELHGVGDQSLTVGDGTAFGTWALIDEHASLLRARAARPTRLLRIARGDFHDLLADHPELALGMLQGLARRLRTVAA